MAGGGYDLEEISRRTSLTEIVAPHVTLRRAGRRLTGLCPFHQEKTPSFSVDPETGLWYCFGCKTGGDLFRFVEMIEKVPFAEAVELLARRLGVAPKSPAQAARLGERDRLLAIHTKAAGFFQQQLRSDVGKRARDYLSSRGISSQTAHEFGLGYAPDEWEALLATLDQARFSGKELAQAGLAIPKDDRFYDRFRDRIIFPIWDVGGRIIAFGGRALTEEQQPKYLNSPETTLFHKGATLYGFDRARRTMAEAGRAIIVEGYLDAIACHEAGFTETVATMGTALTQQHLELLRRRVERLVLAFDADSAGMTAALRAKELFAQAGFTVLVLTLPEGLDPDRAIRDRGQEEFKALIDSAVPMMEWELGRILAKAEGAADHEKMQILHQAIKALVNVSSETEQQHYYHFLAERIDYDLLNRTAGTEAAIYKEWLKVARKAGSPRRIVTPMEKEVSDQPQQASRVGSPQVVKSRAASELLAAFLQDSDLAARYGADLEPEDFAEQEQQEIFSVIRRLLDRGQPAKAELVMQEVGPEARAILAELLLGQIPPERLEESVKRAVRRLLQNRLRRLEVVLKQQLAEVQTGEEQEALLRRKEEYRQRLSELTGQGSIGE